MTSSADKVEFWQDADPVRPALWNPNAAACWSILFTPVFGALLHAANWRALGEPARARTNVFCVWVTVALLVLHAGALFVTHSDAMNLYIQTGFVGILVGWYFTIGRTQARYIKAERPDYVKKGWGVPLLAALCVWGAYLGILFSIMNATYRWNPNVLAEEVKPSILEEWHKSPELRDASIQRVTLNHKEGNRYTGFVDATLGGRPERLTLEVELVGDEITWKVEPLDEKSDK
jgi:hypothetical protein